MRRKELPLKIYSFLFPSCLCVDRARQGISEKSSARKRHGSPPRHNGRKRAEEVLGRRAEATELGLFHFACVSLMKEDFTKRHYRLAAEDRLTLLSALISFK